MAKTDKEQHFIHECINMGISIQDAQLLVDYLNKWWHEVLPKEDEPVFPRLISKGLGEYLIDQLKNARDEARDKGSNTKARELDAFLQVMKYGAHKVRPEHLDIPDSI